MEEDFLGFSVGANSYANRWIGAAGKMSLVILLGLFLSACAGSDMKTDRQVATDRVNAYLAANPATTREIADVMRRYKLRKGMTPNLVVAVWGPPKRKVSWRDGTESQWYFTCGNWPHSCPGMGRSKGRSEDDISPQAFFRDGRLYDWKTP